MQVQLLPFHKVLWRSPVYDAGLWMSWQILPEDEGHPQRKDDWWWWRKMEGKFHYSHLCTAKESV